MQRFLLSLVVLALGLIVACGGGSDDGDEGNDEGGDPASPTATASAAPSGGGSTGGSSASTPAPSSGGGDSDFCSPAGAEAVFNGFDFTGAGDLEATLGSLGPALEAWIENAPSEIRDDARLASETMRGLIELLEENDYNVFALGGAAAADPRFAAIESPEFTAATDRIAAYCGIEVPAAPALDGGAAGGGTAPFNPTFGEGTLPEDFPEELIPPSSQVGVTADAGLGLTVQFMTTATIDEVIEFYTDLLGSPLASDSDGTIWSQISASSGATVSVMELDGAVIVTVVVVSS